jgi:hypothetical protein
LFLTFIAFGNMETPASGTADSSSGEAAATSSSQRTNSSAEDGSSPGMASRPEQVRDPNLATSAPQNATSPLEEDLLPAISSLNIGDHVDIYVPSAGPEVSEERKLLK